MTLIGLIPSQESSDSLFSVLSAVLWLGNLRYRGERDDDCLNDTAALADSDAAVFRTIADLLNVDYAQLVQVGAHLTNRYLVPTYLSTKHLYTAGPMK